MWIYNGSGNDQDVVQQQAVILQLLLVIPVLLFQQLISRQITQHQIHNILNKQNSKREISVGVSTEQSSGVSEQIQIPQ
jgi:hypothetical protein